MIRLTNNPVWIKVFGQIAYKHSLFTSDGMLKYWYNAPQGVEQIALARIDGQYVGCGLLLKGNYLAEGNELINIAVFVKKNYRRQKIGTQLIQHIQQHTDRELILWSKGFRSDFFKKATEQLCHQN